MVKSLLQIFTLKKLLILYTISLSACSFEASLSKKTLSSNDSSPKTELIPPLINSVSPATIETTTGGIITISGSNFVDNMTVDLIASNSTVTSCSVVTFVNENQITCLAPAASADIYTIRVTGPNLTPVLLSSMLTYIATPACLSSITNNFGGGDGSLEDPYRICNLDQWNYFGSMDTAWNKYIQLEANLDFTGLAYADFKMIGNGTTSFTGTFNGNNFTVKNITVNGGANIVALFLNTNGNATIKNLKVNDINLSSTTASAALVGTHGTSGTLLIQNITGQNFYFSTSGGGLIYSSLGPLQVENVTLNTITFGGASGSGIATIISDAGTFNNINLNILTTNPFGGSKLGGVLGRKVGGSSIKDLNFSNLQITGLNIGSGGATYVGGIAGQISDANVSISNSSTSGTIRGSSWVGGILGAIEPWSSTGGSLYIFKSSYNGSMSGAYLSGGIVGYAANIAVNIQESFSKGSLNTWGDGNGGIAGYLAHTGAGSILKNNYSQMTINGTQTTCCDSNGGILGVYDTGSIQIQNSYFSGSLTKSFAGSILGCVVGNYSSSTITLNNVYYDSTRCTANAVNSAAFTGATGLATGSFQTASLFTNWDPLIWFFVSGQDSKLLWEP